MELRPLKVHRQAEFAQPRQGFLAQTADEFHGHTGSQELGKKGQLPVPAKAG
jgi:hypothetical protein